MKHLNSLVKKYDTPGPRYTSYPTAPHFSQDCDKAELIKKAVEKNSPRSLYVHIPFCRSICFFCGCSSSVCLDSKKADAYLDLLQKELALWKNAGLARCELGQIHFGGGTPNFLEAHQILRLREIIGEFFDIQNDCEFSVELDPRTLSEEKVKAFAQSGVNRASMGVQDTTPEVQRAINRVQPQHMNLECAQMLRENGIVKINADLIYGLPLQTPENFANTIRDVLALNPDRIALFNYAHVPWMKSTQKPIEKFHIPQGDEKLALFTSAMDAFDGAGFEYIGLDHFARPDDELIKARKNGTLHRNFQGYSTRVNLESFGLGLTSISQTTDSYRQNKKILLAYEASLAKNELSLERGIILNSEDILRRRIIMDVMCLLHLDFSKYADNFKEKFAPALAKLSEMQNDGLVELDENSLRVTKLGRLFLRNIAMLFDGRLPSDGARYSKTL